MRREERRRKFHEAVLDTLYPPPSPTQPEDDDKPVTTQGDLFDVELINPEDFVKTGSSTSDDDDDGGESELQKLSRAQRKRLRKKKLKEESSLRGNLIGPLLPPTTTSNDGSGDDGCNVVENESQSVRRNAHEDCAATTENQGEESSCGTKNKLKQRRMAKKLAKEKSTSFSADICDENKKLESSNVESSDQERHSSGQI